MKQTLTAKLKIVPTEVDATLLADTMHAYTSACNFASEYIFETHDLVQASLNRALYHNIRTNFGLRSQMAQSVLKTVIARYRTILTNQHKWIKPVFRKPELDLVWNRDYSLNADKTLFSVNTLDGRILHVPVTKEINALSMSDVSNIVGVDRGIRFLAATYNSNGKSVFCSGNAVKEKRAHYKALRKQLQQVGTPSSRRRLKALGQRENRWMRDVNHCVSKALVENNPEGTLFVLEDLNNIRKATERVCKDGRYVSVSWAYFDLEQKLKYKALKNRQLVVNVDPAYTSQTCPKCGHVAKSNRDKKKHLFCCENCGYTSNDDRIGAMNLHRMGIEYLVQCQGSNAPLAG